MNEIIDLDKLLPEPKTVRISGKELQIFPGKIKALIRIQKAFASFKNATEDNKTDLMDSVVNALSAIMPGITDEDVDISMEQLPVLVNMAYQLSTPEKSVEVKANKMNVDNTSEKKMVKTSPEQ